MTEAERHVNVLINASVDETDHGRETAYNTDDERLLKPRNNFASYSNDDVTVRFRVSIEIRRLRLTVL